MPFRGKGLDSLTFDDVKQLVDGHYCERHRIDWKSALPGGTPAERKEFLADVSSFANADGGYIVYGVTESGGVPTGICGLGTIDAERKIQQLEHLANQHLTPRVQPPLHLRAVYGPSGEIVIVLHVPRSQVCPHMIWMDQDQGFWTRASNGKRKRDVEELRALFIRGATREDKTRAFCEERIAAVRAGNAPVALHDGPLLVLHLVPFNAFDPDVSLDTTSMAGDGAPTLWPIGASAVDYRHNVDGWLSFYEPNSAGCGKYAQLYRNGCIETVRGWEPGSRGLRILDVEDAVVNKMQGYADVYKHLAVQPPISVQLTLLSAKGLRFDTNGYWNMAAPDEPVGISGDVVVCGPVVWHDLSEDPLLLVQPLFDRLWQAAGWPRSLRIQDMLSQRGQGVG